MKVVKRKKGFKETVRKFIVSLKRRPHNIPLVFIAVTFLVYALKLTAVSNTTGFINRNPMGLCEFVTMLVSILAMVTFLRAFPKRQKPNIIMVILLFALEAAIIVCDAIYLSKINAWKADTPDYVEKMAVNTFVSATYSMLIAHIVMLGISILLIALIPVFGKLFNLIDTSVDLGENAGVTKIDTTDE